MCQKGLLNNGYFAIIIIMSCIVFVSGCSTTGWGYRCMSGVSRYFDEDKETVWAAVLQTLEGIPIEVSDREKGFIKTRWVERWSEKKTTGLLFEGRWHERHRFLINVKKKDEKVYVSVNALVEEKPPGGSKAFRWDRVASDGTLERIFMDRLENILIGSDTPYD